jgi:hypothetical protein
MRYTSSTLLNTTMIPRISTCKDAGIHQRQCICGSWWSGLPTVCWNCHGYDLRPFISGSVFVSIRMRQNSFKNLCTCEEKSSCYGHQFDISINRRCFIYLNYNQFHTYIPMSRKSKTLKSTPFLFRIKIYYWNWILMAY